MADSEMYDFLSNATPDYEYTLDIPCFDIVREDGEKYIENNEADDQSEESIILSDDSVFYVSVIYRDLTRSQAGTIFSLYHDSDKACGTAKSFWWQPITSYDGHTYVVKFRGSLGRFYQNYLRYGFATITLKVIGRKPD